MELTDDRTEEQRRTHPHLIGGTDSFLSGWGKARGGASYAFWACRPEHRKAVLEWVESRSDMKRVREVSRNYRPKGTGHCHVYVVESGHPAIARLEAFLLECHTTEPMP